MLTPPSVAQDPAESAGIDARFPRGPDELPWISGRRKVRVLVVAGGIPEEEKLSSPAQRVVGQQALVTGPRRRARVADVEVLARLVASARTRWIVGVNDTELLATLARELGPPKPPR